MLSIKTFDLALLCLLLPLFLFLFGVLLDIGLELCNSVNESQYLAVEEGTGALTLLE